MNKILLTIPFLIILIPISANAETYTFNLPGEDEIEEKFWFPSGSVEYSIHVSGGDERVVLKLLDPKFNSLGDGWITQSHSNWIITDKIMAKQGNIGPMHPSSEGTHTFTFINPNSGDRTIQLRLDINEYDSQEQENELYCGPGTHDEEGRCVPNIQGEKFDKLLDENKKLREEFDRQGQQINQVDYLSEIINSIKEFFGSIFG